MTSGTSLSMAASACATDSTTKSRAATYSRTSVRRSVRRVESPSMASMRGMAMFLIVNSADV